MVHINWGQLAIVAMELIVPFVIALILGSLIQKYYKQFKQNKKHGTALITSYDSQSTSCKVRFAVQVLETNNKDSHLLQGTYNIRNADESINEQYPYFHIGEKVQVLYTTQSLLGVDFFNVRLDEEFYKKGEV